MKISGITPVLQAILDFFPDIISFQHVFHLGVGRSQIEWKLKAKTQISVFPGAKIGQNDHSNPYIESTTVLSDNIILVKVPCECITGKYCTRVRCGREPIKHEVQPSALFAPDHAPSAIFSVMHERERYFNWFIVVAFYLQPISTIRNGLSEVSCPHDARTEPWQDR